MLKKISTAIYERNSVIICASILILSFGHRVGHLHLCYPTDNKEIAQGSVKAYLPCRTYFCSAAQAGKDSAWLGISPIIFPANYELWKFTFSAFKASVSCWNSARKKWNSTMTFLFFSFFFLQSETCRLYEKLVYSKCYYAFSATLLCPACVF